jgi:hypothetical protein
MRGGWTAPRMPGSAVLPSQGSWLLSGMSRFGVYANRGRVEYRRVRIERINSGKSLNQSGTAERLTVSTDRHPLVDDTNTGRVEMAVGANVVEGRVREKIRSVSLRFPGTPTDKPDNHGPTVVPYSLF